MLGKLTWVAFPFDQPIIMGTVAVVGLVGLIILGLVSRDGGPICVGNGLRASITSGSESRISS